MRSACTCLRRRCTDAFWSRTWCPSTSSITSVRCPLSAARSVQPAEQARRGGTITNTLGNVGGIVCDGAKPSCAAKIASSVHAALLAHYMSMSMKEFRGGEGFVESDVEKTIKNMGYIGKIGMKSA